VRFLETPLPGVILVRPDVHRDARGFFVETYHAPRYREAGIREAFVQDNHSRSVRDTLRGLHAQSPHPQGKLLRVIEGEIFDVAVDVRRGSPAYGKFFASRLTAEGFEQLYVPPGLAHGFLVTSEVAQVEYKCTQVYDPRSEFSIAWDDPDLAIPWPTQSPRLSERDRRAPRLRELEHRLIDYPAR
jgi:dTDP-4-dehydrorhamnose 3,5-epimerase